MFYGSEGLSYAETDTLARLLANLLWSSEIMATVGGTLA